MAVHARHGQPRLRARRFAPKLGFAPRRLWDAASATSARWVAPRKQRISFQYDAAHDIVIATPRWTIKTEEDVRTWYAQYEAYLKRFRRVIDFIVVLDDFKVATTIGPFWGACRERASIILRKAEGQISGSNIRAFGYLILGAKPALSQRTVNEAAAVADYVNANILTK